MYSNQNDYTCALHNYTILVQRPAVTLDSEPISPVSLQSDVTLSCTVELGPAVSQSDVPLLTVDAQLSRDGTPLALTGPTVTGTTFTYTIQLDSFGRSDSGNYTCTATVRPQTTSTYLTGNETFSRVTEVTTGKTSMNIKSFIN